MKNLSDVKTIKQILNRHGFKFSKSLGQNFLINPEVCPKMAEICDIKNKTEILEIGPGIGVLTCELAKKAKKVVSIELDKRLIPVLKETLCDFTNIKVINQDILKINLQKLFEEEFSGNDIVICANLPYYITSQIIMKLLESKLKIRAIVVMVQKEVADRLCAGAGDKQSGSISVTIDYYCIPEHGFIVKSNSFIPSPKVDSEVIKLNVRENPPVNLVNEKLFFKVVKMAFLQRRKTIINSLTHAFKLNKENFTNGLEKLNILPSNRAENLTLSQFADISNLLSNL